MQWAKQQILLLKFWLLKFSNGPMFVNQTNVYIVDGKCQCKFFKSMLEAPSSLIHIMATVDAVKSCMSTQTLIDRLQQRTAQFRSPNYDKLQVCCFCWLRLAILPKFPKQKKQTKIAFQHQPQARISKENYHGITVGIQPPTFRHAQTKNNFSLMFFFCQPVNFRPSHSVRDSLNQSNNPCFVHRTMNRLPFSPSIPPPFNFHMNPQTRYRPKIKFELKDHDNPTCENFRLLFTVGGEDQGSDDPNIATNMKIPGFSKKTT
jgi:hypothetical protein